MPGLKAAKNVKPGDINVNSALFASPAIEDTFKKLKKVGVDSELSWNPLTRTHNIYSTLKDGTLLKPIEDVASATKAEFENALSSVLEKATRSKQVQSDRKLAKKIAKQEFKGTKKSYLSYENAEYPRLGKRNTPHSTINTLSQSLPKTHSLTPKMPKLEVEIPNSSRMASTPVMSRKPLQGISSNPALEQFEGHYEDRYVSPFAYDHGRPSQGRRLGDLIHGPKRFKNEAISKSLEEQHSISPQQSFYSLSNSSAGSFHTPSTSPKPNRDSWPEIPQEYLRQVRNSPTNLSDVLELDEPASRSISRQTSTDSRFSLSSH